MFLLELHGDFTSLVMVIIIKTRSWRGKCSWTHEHPSCGVFLRAAHRIFWCELNLQYYSKWRRAMQ